MAAHFLQQIVDGVVTKLTTPSVITGLAGAGNVFSADDYPREAGSLPCVNVQANGFQRAERGTDGNRPMATNLCDIRVQCVALNQRSGRATAIALAKAVEERWLGTTADEKLVGIMAAPLQRVQLVDVNVDTDTDGDGACAVAEMVFQVKVLSIEGKPDLT